MSRTTLLLLVLVGTALAEPAQAITIVDMPLPDRGIERIKLSVGGFLQPRFTFSPIDEEAGSQGELGFSVRRARLEVQGGLSVPITGKKFALVIDHALSVEFTPEARLQDAWFELGAGDFLRLRVGQQKTPTNRAQLSSDANTMFPERGHNEALSPRRDIGLQLGGKLFDRHRIEYAVGVFNGEGTNRVANVNRKFLYAARLAFSPLGTPGTRNEVPDPRKGWLCTDGVSHAFTFTAGYSWNFNQTGPPGTEESAMGHNVELFAHYRWFTLQAEFLYKVTDFQEPALVDYDGYDVYGQLALFPPMVPWVQDHLAFIVRYEEHDDFMQRARSEDEAPVPLSGPTDPGQKERSVSFGLTYYAGAPLFLGIGDLRVQAVYTLRAETEGLPYRNNAFVLAAHLSI